MNNFLIGFFVSLILFLIILLFCILAKEGESINIANECKSYGMATINKKVYNCTLKDVK